MYVYHTISQTPIVVEIPPFIPPIIVLHSQQVFHSETSFSSFDFQITISIHHSESQDDFWFANYYMYFVAFSKTCMHIKNIYVRTYVLTYSGFLNKAYWSDLQNNVWCVPQELRKVTACNPVDHCTGWWYINKDKGSMHGGVGKFIRQRKAY